MLPNHLDNIELGGSRGDYKKQFQYFLIVRLPLFSLAFLFSSLVRHHAFFSTLLIWGLQAGSEKFQYFLTVRFPIFPVALSFNRLARHRTVWSPALAPSVGWGSICFCHCGKSGGQANVGPARKAGERVGGRAGGHSRNRLTGRMGGQAAMCSRSTAARPGGRAAGRPGGHGGHGGQAVGRSGGQAVGRTSGQADKRPGGWAAGRNRRSI